MELERLHTLILNAPNDAVLSHLQRKLSEWVVWAIEEDEKGGDTRSTQGECVDDLEALGDTDSEGTEDLEHEPGGDSEPEYIPFNFVSDDSGIEE